MSSSGSEFESSADESSTTNNNENDQFAALSSESEPEAFEDAIDTSLMPAHRSAYDDLDDDEVDEQEPITDFREQEEEEPPIDRQEEPPVDLQEEEPPVDPQEEEPLIDPQEEDHPTVPQEEPHTDPQEQELSIELQKQEEKKHRRKVSAERKKKKLLEEEQKKQKLEQSLKDAKNRAKEKMSIAKSAPIVPDHMQKDRDRVDGLLALLSKGAVDQESVEKKIETRIRHQESLIMEKRLAKQDFDVNQDQLEFYESKLIEVRNMCFGKGVEEHDDKMEIDSPTIKDFYESKLVEARKGVQENDSQAPKEKIPKWVDNVAGTAVVPMSPPARQPAKRARAQEPYTPPPDNYSNGRPSKKRRAERPWKQEDKSMFLRREIVDLIHKIGDKIPLENLDMSEFGTGASKSQEMGVLLAVEIFKSLYPNLKPRDFFAKLKHEDHWSAGDFSTKTPLLQAIPNLPKALPWLALMMGTSVPELFWMMEKIVPAKTE